MFDIPAAIEASSNLISGIVNRIWPDPTEADKNKLARFQAEMAQELAIVEAQTNINMQEAQHKSVFVSGWRPFIGWVCGVALVYASLIEPFVRFVAVVLFGYVGEFPVIDTDITLQILLGLLGLAGMRSFEKARGVASAR